jgi:hypothetical protein
VFVRVRHDRYLCPAAATLVEGDRHRFALTRGFHISGRVVTPDGSPPLPGYARVLDFRGAHVAVTNTVLDGGGFFRLGPLPIGSYEIEVFSRGIYRWLRAKAGEDSLLIRLDTDPVEEWPRDVVNHGSLTVTWRGPGGRPATSGRVAHHFTGGTDPLVLDRPASGRVEYRVLKPGVPVWFEISGAKDAGGKALGAQIRGPYRIAGGRNHISLELEPGQSVGGRVIGEDGDGLGGLVVTARRTPFGCFPARNAHGTATTGADGRFRIDGLGEMDYDLLVRTPSTWAIPGPVRATPGAEAAVIRLSRATPLVVRVLDPDGKPLDRVRVVAVPDGGMERPVRAFSKNGRAAFPRLDPGREYTVRIAGVGEGWAFEAAGLSPGGEETVARLRPGLTIRGRFTVPRGADRYRVHARCEGLFVTGRVEPDGRFEIRGLTPGRWKVSLTVHAGRERSWSGGAEVAAGAEATITLKAD